MTDHSEARVEAAAKAVVVALEPYVSYSRMTYSGSVGLGAKPAELAGAVLAAADEADRAAGVIRVDTNDEALMESAADWISDMYVTDPELRYNVVLAFRALAALSAGAQPPPENVG